MDTILLRTLLRPSTDVSWQRHRRRRGEVGGVLTLAAAAHHRWWDQLRLRSLILPVRPKLWVMPPVAPAAADSGS